MTDSLGSDIALAQASSAIKQTHRLATIHKLLIGLLSAVTVIDYLWLRYLSPLPIDHRFLWILIPICGALLLLWAFYQFIRREQRISYPLLVAFELLFFTYSCSILSYLVTGLSFPWQDGFLATMDHVLGFDWVAYQQFVARRPWLYLTFGLLYQSSIPQLGCLVLLLGFAAHLRDLTKLVSLIIGGGLITLTIGALLPARGAYSYFNVPDHGLATFAVATISVHDHTLKVIDPAHLEGLVMFPSYHTMLSIGFIVAAWRLRYLRYLFLGINLLLILSVPIFGGHYLTDMIGGTVVAIVFFALWRMTMPGFSKES